MQVDIKLDSVWLEIKELQTDLEVLLAANKMRVNESTDDDDADYLKLTNEYLQNRLWKVQGIINQLNQLENYLKHVEIVRRPNETK